MKSNYQNGPGEKQLPLHSNSRNIMKKLLIIALFYVAWIAPQSVEITAAKRGTIPLLLGYICKQDSETVKELASIIEKDFSFTNQFTVTTRQFDVVPTKKEMRTLRSKENNFLFALFISPSGNNFEWSLYNLMETKIVACKRYKRKGDSIRGWAHNIADMAWTPLTSQEGFFSTKVTYAKEVQSGRGKCVKHIYVADYDGSNEQVLVSTPTINVAPRWNGDLKKPLIFYSDFTQTNVRLMVTDLNHHLSIASDFDGVNMIPAFSKDGKKVVYCLSRGDGSCQLYLYEKGNFKRITKNNGNNVSPTLADNGKTIYFCSDFQTGSPQIFSYVTDKDELERLTDGGYCASPRFSEKAQKLAYGKIINGFMQLFVYDLKMKTHEQITFDECNKEEYSWSPCGTKLVYNVVNGSKGRIAMINLHDRNVHYITAQNANCSYPDWSPVYYEYPIIVVNKKRW